MLGNFIGEAVRIVNTPIKTVEKLLTIEETISIPLETLAEEFESIDSSKEKEGS